MPDMAEFRAETTLDQPIEVVFDFHLRPRNFLLLLPADVQAELLEGPELVSVGSDVELKFLVWGMTQRVRSRITVLDRPHMVIDEQIKGPFRKFRQTQRFEALDPQRTRLEYLAEFEPPGGMLGFIATQDTIREYLRKSTLYRLARMRELLEPSP